jgi:hypothetical protein
MGYKKRNKTMSEATLTSLLEYLYGALTPSNQRWVAEHLIEHAEVEEGEVLKPYTVEELLERAEKGRQEIARGNYVTSEDLFRDLFAEYGLDPSDMEEIDRQVEETKLQYAEAI